jgi:hypothetical protein
VSGDDPSCQEVTEVLALVGASGSKVGNGEGCRCSEEGRVTLADVLAKISGRRVLGVTNNEGKFISLETLVSFLSI